MQSQFIPCPGNLLGVFRSAILVATRRSYVDLVLDFSAFAHEYSLSSHLNLDSVILGHLGVSGGMFGGLFFAAIMEKE